MRKLPLVYAKRFYITLCFFACTQWSFAQDKLIRILDEEVQREIQILKQQEVPAYYINYRVDEIYRYQIVSSFGALTYSLSNNSRYVTVTVRVGSSKMDNYHQIRDNYFDFRDYLPIDLPSTEEPLAIKQVLWNATNDAYQQAVAKFSKVRATVAVKVEEEDKSPDFTLEEQQNYFEPPINLEDIKLDIPSWENRTRKYSMAFLKDSAIFDGTSSWGFQIIRKYFVSSDGDKIAQNNTSATMYVNGTIKAKDGMEMPLYKSFFAFMPEAD